MRAARAPKDPKKAVVEAPRAPRKGAPREAEVDVGPAQSTKVGIATKGSNGKIYEAATYNHR